MNTVDNLERSWNAGSPMIEFVFPEDYFRQQLGEWRNETDFEVFVVYPLNAFSHKLIQFSKCSSVMAKPNDLDYPPVALIEYRLKPPESL